MSLRKEAGESDRGPGKNEVAGDRCVRACQTVQVPILLIRHAQAGARSEWKKDDMLRPLSAKGKQQARQLAKVASEWAPQRVLSSPWVRCIETVAPLGKQIGLQVEVSKALGEGSTAEAVKLVRSLSDEKVALCTHGDVIPEVLVALADEDRLDLGPRPKQQKASIWILEASNGRFTRARYLPPPEL